MKIKFLINDNFKNFYIYLFLNLDNINIYFLNNKIIKLYFKN